VDLVRSIGADEVIDYARDHPAGTGRRNDVILDTAGNRSLSELRGALAPRGTLVIVGGEEGRWTGGFDRALWALMLSPFVSQELSALVSTENAKDLLVLKELIEAGKATRSSRRRIR
jgi:NADPH:quinone reductase-like Zn-dependent oxidoreductase